MSNYTRVIPRDLFNESKLLKCMGQLSVKVLDCEMPEGMEINVSDGDGEPFDIVKDESDGSIHVQNYPVTINEVSYRFFTPEHAKDPYPLMIRLMNEEEVKVFDNWGEFTDEFRAINI